MALRGIGNIVYSTNILMESVSNILDYHYLSELKFRKPIFSKLLIGRGFLIIC